VINYLLTVDGFIDRAESKRRLSALHWEIAKEFLPALLRYALPGYHPLKEKEPEGYAEWMQDHAYDTGIARGIA
jgi:hypothetical protein